MKYSRKYTRGLQILRSADLLTDDPRDRRQVYALLHRYGYVWQTTVQQWISGAPVLQVVHLLERRDRGDTDYTLLGIYTSEANARAGAEAHIKDALTSRSAIAWHIMTGVSAVYDYYILGLWTVAVLDYWGHEVRREQVRFRIITEGVDRLISDQEEERLSMRCCHE